MEPASRFASSAIPSILALLLLASATLVAQDAATPAQPDPQQIDAAVLLQKAIKKMASLNSVRFKTTESQDVASTRQIMKQMAGLGGGMLGGGQDKIVRGHSSDGVLHAKMNDGDDEAVLYRGRMVARSDSDWKLRRNYLYGSGRSVPEPPTGCGWSCPGSERSDSPRGARASVAATAVSSRSARAAW